MFGLKFTFSRRFRSLPWILAGLDVLVVLSGVAQIISGSFWGWVWLTIGLVFAADLVLSRKSGPHKQQVALHAEIYRSCKQLLQGTDVFTGIADSRGIQVRRNGWATYSIAVAETNDDLHYDAETMRNLEFLTARFFVANPFTADLRKSTEVGRISGDEAVLMDNIPSQSLPRQARNIRKAPWEMNFATVAEMQEIAKLLDKAEPVQMD